MTSEQKSLIISQISLLLDQMVEAPVEPKAPVKDGPREMLTTKECLETVKGLSFHTLRVLIARGKIQSFRAGEGKRARVFVSKSSLLEYFDSL